MTSRGLGVAEMEQIADCIWRTATDYEASTDEVRAIVSEITGRFPVYK